MIKLRTRILLGALIQILLYAALPTRWAVVPACAMLLHSTCLTVIQLLSPNTKNTFVHGVVPGRVTAQIPPAGPTPAAHSVVVFNLGVQYNHPLGPLSPAGRQINRYFDAMQRDLHSRRHELGLLDMSFWRAGERESNSTLLTTMVFRDIEGLHRFAHEPIHREAWDWWSGKARSPAYTGVFHETFCVPAGEYETLYVNCRPVLFGRGQVRMVGGGKDGEEGEEWRSTLVSADEPALKTQYARMNRREDGTVKG